MLTLISLVAAYIPCIIFTINWKLPWEFDTGHCTSEWRRGSVKLEWAGSACGLSGVIWRMVKYSQLSWEPGVQESTSGGVGV